MKILARSYIKSAQGKIESVSFNTHNGVFKSEFTVDTSIDAPTVIHTNKEFWYPKGVKAKVTPHDDSTEITYNDNSVSVKVNNPELSGQTMKIHIR